MRRPLHLVLLPLLFGALALLGWHFGRDLISEDYQFLLPRPGDVVRALVVEHRQELVRAALNTAQGATLGFGSAALVSFLLGLVLSLSPRVRASLYPYLMILQMMPVVVVAPILVLWVGPGLKSVTIITFLVCFFPMVVNTTQGLISTDRHLVELFRLYRATRWQTIWRLRVPAALPYILTGLRIAAVLAPIGALVGDYTAGTSAGDGGGLGFQAIIYSNQAKYPALFATAAVTCVLGFIFVAGVIALSWFALHKWHDSYEHTDH